MKNFISPNLLRIASFSIVVTALLLNCTSSWAQSSLKSDLEQSKVKNLWTRKSGIDWPTFLGVNQDGKSDEKGILKDWSQGNLKILWSAELGEGYGIGSVSAGRFFQFDYDGKESKKARLRCFNAESGDQLWEFKYDSKYVDMFNYDSGPRSSPVVDGDRVYIFGVEGMLHCLNVTDGDLIWKLDTSKRFGVIQNFFGVASSPRVVGDNLVVMVGGSPEESKKVSPRQLNLVKPNGSAIVGLDKRTGEVKYQVGDDLASYSSLVSARIQLDDQPQDVVYAFARSGLIGLTADEGKVFLNFPWRARKLESVNASSPVVDGNRVLICECYEIGAALLDTAKIDAESKAPEVIWSDGKKRGRSLETHWNTPVLVDGHLYASSGQHSATAELRCVELETGKVKWSQPRLTRSSLTYVDGHLVVVCENGRLQLIKASPESYQVVTQYEPGEDGGVRFRTPCWAAPVISHGLMWVRGKSKLICFELIEDKK